MAESHRETNEVIPEQRSARTGRVMGYDTLINFTPPYLAAGSPYSNQLTERYQPGHTPRYSTNGSESRSSNSRSRFLDLFVCCRSRRSSQQQQLPQPVSVSVPVPDEIIYLDDLNKDFQNLTLELKTSETEQDPERTFSNGQEINQNITSPRTVIARDIFTYNGKLQQSSDTEKEVVDRLATKINFSPTTAKILNSHSAFILKLVSCRDSFANSLTTLQIFNCELKIEDFVQVLLRCGNLEDLTISNSGETYNLYKREGEIIGKSALEDPTSLANYTKYTGDVVSEFLQKFNGIQRPSKLKWVTIHLPYVKGCSVLCSILDLVYKSLGLWVLKIETSQQKMLALTKEIMQEPEEYEQSFIDEFITLDCNQILDKCSDTLSHLVLSCEDKFPLEWLRDVPNSKEDLGLTFHYKFLLSQGLLASFLPTEQYVARRFIRLAKLSLNLPILKIIPSWTEDKENSEVHANIYSFLSRFDTFLSVSKLNLQELSLAGIRPTKVMLPWMKEHFIWEKCTTELGVIYFAFELSEQLYQYYDELTSLGIIIRPDDTQINLQECLKPSTGDIEQMPAVKTLHIVNRKPNLLSFSVPTLVNKFLKLSTLVIENYKGEAGSSGDSSVMPFSLAKVTDDDLIVIIKELCSTLRHLHVDCDMNGVSDMVMVGVMKKQSRFVSISPARHVQSVSLGNLTELEYLYLKGLGDDVTNFSVDFCFAEDFAFPKLAELHLFAPMITREKKSLIRKAYGNRPGFIMELGE